MKVELRFNQLSWKAVLTKHPNQDLAHIHNSSPSLSDDVIMSVGTHESRSASIIPRGSSWATWWPRIYRRQEVPPQTWEPSAKPPTRKRYRRGEKAGTEEEVQNSKRTRRLRLSVIEDEMKCRVQRGLGYKSWKTGERRKWEKEGQIKGRGKRQSHKTGSLMVVCWAVGNRKHFSPTCWNPVATGDSSKFTQLMPSGSRFALWCPITWKQGNSSHKTLSSPSRSHDCELSPIFHSVTNVRCETMQPKWGIAQFGIFNQTRLSARGRTIYHFTD